MGIPSPMEADDPLAGRLKPAPKNECPSSCPSRPRAGQNKRTRRPGKCSLPRPNEQSCSPTALCFAPPRIANKDTSTESVGSQKQIICDRRRRGALRPTSSRHKKHHERNVLRQGVRRTTSRMPTCACLCERQENFPLGIQSGHHATIKCECIRQR